MGTQEAALGLIGNSDASGQVGQRVAQRLARQGLRQRLLVQDRSQAPELPQSEVAPISDYGDTESMRKALAGVDTLLLIPIKEHPERVRLHQTAIDAAVAAGSGASSTPRSWPPRLMQPSPSPATTTPPSNTSGPRGWRSPSCAAAPSWRSFAGSSVTTG
jgi:hypothetical protein